MFAVTIAIVSRRLPDGGEVENQVAAPTETRTSNLHRAKNRSSTECGWKDDGRGGPLGKVRTERKLFLTLTGLLMESDCTQNPVVGEIAILRQLSKASFGRADRQPTDPASALGTLVDHEVSPRRPGIHNPGACLLRRRRQPCGRGVEGPHNHPMRRFFDRRA